MGIESSATLNYQLTTFAQGHMNDLADARGLAERLAPSTPVPGSTGQFKKFNDKNSFLPEDTSRALGGDPKLIATSATDDTYSCKPQALEVRVDQAEIDAAGSGAGALGQQLLREGKVAALLNKAALSHSVQVVTAVLAAVTPQPSLGVWSDPDIDPIDQLDSQLLALSNDCGSATNIKLTIDVGAWSALRSHPKVKTRCEGVQVGGITREQLASLLLFPVDVFIATIVKDTAGFGLTPNKTRVIASEALLHYSVPNATLYDPSPFKTFTVGMGSPFSGVRSYQAPNGLWEGHLIDWSRDIKQTSALAMRRLSIS
jgi:hypothetical protein